MAFFFPAAASSVTAANNSATLVFLFFLVILFFVFVLVVVEVFVLFLFFFLFFLSGLDFYRIQPSDVEIGATLVAGQRVAFIQFILVYVDHGVAFGAVHHLAFLQGTITLYKNSARNAYAFALAIRLRVVGGTRPFNRRYTKSCWRWVSSCSLMNCSISRRVTRWPSMRVISAE